MEQRGPLDLNKFKGEVDACGCLPARDQINETMLNGDNK